MEYWSIGVMGSEFKVAGSRFKVGSTANFEL
jgi:hypothetical protein